jgi:hypothetical protein
MRTPVLPLIGLCIMLAVATIMGLIALVQDLMR